MSDYVAWGHVVASPEGALHGSVDDALAELGTKTCKIASVVPGFPTALSVALESDLIAMIPALYLLNQQVTDQYTFRAAFKKPSYYGIADVAPKNGTRPRSPLAERANSCDMRCGRSVMTKSPV